MLQINQRAWGQLWALTYRNKVAKFRNIWHFTCNTCEYCIFVYSVLGQVCWPWMTSCTIGSLAHVQYRASWKNVFGVLQSPGIFSKPESGYPAKSNDFQSYLLGVPLQPRQLISTCLCLLLLFFLFCMVSGPRQV